MTPSERSDVDAPAVSPWTRPAAIVPRDSFELVRRVVLYDGRLARIQSVSEGRTVHFVFVEEPPCPTCGHQPGADVLTHSRLFQEKVQPVPTLEFFE